MKEIKLGGKYGSIIGNYAMVDDEDYEELNKYNWFGSSASANTIYARRNISKTKSITMHREIQKGEILDHVDGNGLNNQRHNLRSVTKGQNRSNSIKSIGKYSVYKGVTLKTNKGKSYWVAQCKKDKKLYSIRCKDEISAAKEYNKLAEKLHGEFAKLNIMFDK